MPRLSNDVEAIRKHTAAMEWRGSSRRTLLILVLCPVIAIGIVICIAVALKISDAMEPQGPTPTNPNYGR